MQMQSKMTQFLKIIAIGMLSVLMVVSITSCSNGGTEKTPGTVNSANSSTDPSNTSGLSSNKNIGAATQTAPPPPETSSSEVPSSSQGSSSDSASSGVSSSSQGTSSAETASASSSSSDAASSESDAEVKRFYIEDFVLNKTDGTTVNLSSLAKKNTIVVFWATWCKYCLQEMPTLQELSSREDLSIVLLNTGQSLSTVQEFEKTGTTTLPIYYDEKSSIAQIYGITGFPTILFLTEELELIHLQPGKLEKEQFEHIFDLIDDFRKKRGDY